MKQFDLNLLRVLVALDQTRHVGRAAASLDMSQSGFSTALARLRQQLSDELFVRSARGMQPTPRALALVETGRTVLQQVAQDVLEREAFDPSSAEVSFRLSMSDAAEVIFIPSLIQHLSLHAPRCSVQIYSPNTAPLRDRLAGGEVDLVLGYFPDLEMDAYFRQPLLSQTYACMVRHGHPVLRTGMTRTAYQALGHAVVSIPARSNALLESALERQRIRRRIVLTTPNHLALPATITHSDLVATVPLGTAKNLAKSSPLEVLPLPFRPPSFTVSQYWHRRTQKDAAYQWLRGQFKHLFNASSDNLTAQRKERR